MIRSALLDDRPAPFSSGLISCNSALCSPWITALQLHGVLFGLLLGTLWSLSGWIRLQELRRLRRTASGQQKRREQKGRRRSGRGSAKLSAPQAGTATAPSVTIVLPTRGCRAHSLHNWSAILGLDYGGPLEILFVLEDAKDDGHGAVTALLRKAKGRQVARIVHSGRAVDTSQKIHNLRAGIAAASPSAAYILCLDDDVHLHPATLTSLVADMEGDRSLRVATGYPFDIPPPAASLLTYAALSYHLPLVIAFSLRQRIDFVWGGCMLFRGDDMRRDALGVLAAWARGGYSDDLTVAACCTELGVKVYCPSYCIFPQWLENYHSYMQYWNYLRRQLYVLDTYCNAHARKTNHTLAFLHCYCSWGFVVPAALVVARLLLWATTVAVLLPIHAVYDGPANGSSGSSGDGGDGYLWLQLFGAQAGCGWGLVSLGLFAASAAFAAGALAWMTGVILGLFAELNPSLPRRRLHTLAWPKLWAAFLASNALLPLCMAYTFACSHIDWAGIRYTRRRGRVVSVDH